MKKKKKYLVSVIINCHNGAKFLDKAISSVVKQTHDNWEVIFWNNKSTDQSEQIIKNFKDKRIKYYESEKYLKLYEARNEAIKKTKGKYICFLDSDDWWDRNKIKLQLDELEFNKSNIIYSNYYLFNEEKKYKKLFSKTHLPSGYITEKLLKKYVIAMSSVMISSKFLKKKLFNSMYEVIGDFDFLIRASISNRILCVQKPLLFARIHKKNFSFTRRDLHIFELKNWLKNNFKLLYNFRISLCYQKFYLFKLEFKKLISSFLRVNI
jgi:glycosyltransferase involved in cell wall biosynthesis